MPAFRIPALLATTLAVAGGPPPPAPTPASLERAADYSAGHRGQAVVVLYDGGRVFERYDNGGGMNRLQMLASGSKSFLGVAAAAAVRDGLLTLDDPVSGVLTAWKRDPEKARITYRQLLTLTSGLKASERGFGRPQPAWRTLAAGPMTGTPGGQFAYGAHQLNVFALALEARLGDETFEAYLDRRVLRPAGVTVDWRVRCADGRPQLGGGAFATARDWAAFGEFVRLRGGGGGGGGDRPVVDAAALAACFEGTDCNPAYGQTWWLKRPVTPEARRRIRILDGEWADVANAAWVPDDLVAALGAGKQRLYVVPSRKLVVVRQAGFPGRGFSDLEFLSLLLRDRPATE